MSPPIPVIVRNMTKFTLPKNLEQCNNDSTSSSSFREVFLVAENIGRLEIGEQSLKEAVVNFFLNNITTLVIGEKAFLSCFGTIWLNDIKNATEVHANAFSSSDLRVWHNNQATHNSRPPLTPLQRIKLYYSLSNRLENIGNSLIKNSTDVEVNFELQRSSTTLYSPSRD